VNRDKACEARGKDIQKTPGRIEPGYSDESVLAESPNSEQPFSQGSIAENGRLF
jgi:hypothetical protein